MTTVYEVLKEGFKLGLFSHRCDTTLWFKERYHMNLLDAFTEWDTSGITFKGADIASTCALVLQIYSDLMTDEEIAKFTEWAARDPTEAEVAYIFTHRLTQKQEVALLKASEAKTPQGQLVGMRYIVQTGRGNPNV